MNCCVRNADHNSSSWSIPHYQYLLNEPPRNLLNNNPIILLITLENNKDIKVRTYFFLDTGSSFGCISPMTIAKLLKVNSSKNIHGTTIKTCKKDTVTDRIGSTEDEIKLTYNSRQCYSKFEISDIFISDISILADVPSNLQNS